MDNHTLGVVFSKCFPKAKEKDRRIQAILEYAPRFGINTDKRLAAFLAQVGHECAGFTTFTENLNYSAQGLANTWPTRYSSGKVNGKQVPNALAEKLNRNPELIANYTYADRMDNGSPESGDGWKYRGRGEKQITGKWNYTKISDIMGIDLVSEPDLLLEPENGIIAALHYWDSVNPTGESLSRYADTGDDVSLTKKINGGTLGLQDRKKLRLDILNILSTLNNEV